MDNLCNAICNAFDDSEEQAYDSYVNKVPKAKKNSSKLQSLEPQDLQKNYSIKSTSPSTASLYT